MKTNNSAALKRRNHKEKNLIYGKTTYLNLVVVNYSLKRFSNTFLTFSIHAPYYFCYTQIFLKVFDNTKFFFCKLFFCLRT